MARINIRSNIKFRRLCRRLRPLPAIYVQAHLEAVWATADQQLCPVFETADDIEIAAEWDVSDNVSGVFAEAVIAERFFDETGDGRYFIHDYFQHRADWVVKAFMRRHAISYAEVTGLNMLSYLELRDASKGQGRKSEVGNREDSRNRTATGRQPDGNRTATGSLPEVCLSSVEKGSVEKGSVEKGREEREEEEEPRKRGAAPPYSDFQAAWNETAEAFGLPKCQAMTRGRKTALDRRWKEPYFREKWEAALERIGKSKFLTGQVKDFRADIEFFLRPDSVTKIMEGTYDNEEERQKPKRPMDKYDQMAIDMFGPPPEDAHHG